MDISISTSEDSDEEKYSVIKKYFPDREWQDMGKYEKEAKQSAYDNYILMKKSGIEGAKPPPFMEPKKQSMKKQSKKKKKETISSLEVNLQQQTHTEETSQATPGPSNKHFEEFLTLEIKKALPGIDSELAMEVAEHLVQKLGATSCPLLTYVKEEHLNFEFTRGPLLVLHKLKIIDIIKALAKTDPCPKGAETQTQGQKPTNHHPTVNLPTSSSKAGSMRDLNSDPDFKAIIADYSNGEDSGKQAYDLLKEGKRVCGSIRRILVWAIVDHVRQQVGAKPSVPLLRQFVQKVVNRFQKSFVDEINGKKLKEESGSLFRQVVVRCENLYRKKIEERSGDQHRLKAIVNSHPQPPEDLTEAEAATLIQELREIYKNGPATWNWSKILDLMKKTYFWQRKKIDEVTRKIRGIKEHPGEMDDEHETLVECISREFPFLFTLTGMQAHFEQLTDINAVEEVREFLLNDDSTLLKQYLSMNPKHKLTSLRIEGEQEKEMREHSGDINQSHQRLMLILKLLAAHFEENIQSIIFISKGQNQEDECHSAPDTPHIQAFGSFWFPTNLSLVVDGIVAERNVPDIFTGICLLLMTYFILDISYPPDMTNTLEFVQRIIFGIDPQSGSLRSSKSKRQRFSGAPAKVQSLVAKFSDFKTKLNSK